MPPQWSPLLRSGMTWDGDHASAPWSRAAMEPAPQERDDGLEVEHELSHVCRNGGNPLEPWRLLLW